MESKKVVRKAYLAYLSLPKLTYTALRGTEALRAPKKSGAGTLALALSFSKLLPMPLLDAYIIIAECLAERFPSCIDNHHRGDTRTRTWVRGVGNRDDNRYTISP